MFRNEFQIVRHRPDGHPGSLGHACNVNPDSRIRATAAEFGFRTEHTFGNHGRMRGMRGMSGWKAKRGSYGSMAERVTQGRPPEPAPSRAGADHERRADPLNFHLENETLPDERTYPGRHCFVRAADGSDRRLPALLVECVHTDDDEWIARVVHPVEVEPEVWATLEGWVPARSVERA